MSTFSNENDPTGHKTCSKRQINVVFGSVRRIAFEERKVNVKSVSRINVSFGRNAVVPFSSLLVLNVQKTYKSKSSLNIKSLGRVCFDMTNYSNRMDVMSKRGLNVQNWRYMNVIFWILPDQEGRNFTGSEAK